MGLLHSESQKLLAEDGSQHLDPFRQGNFRRRQCDEHMDVIRHNDVATNSYVVIPRPVAERAEHFMDLTSHEETTAFVSVERHEIKGPNRRKQSVEPRRTPRIFEGSFF